MDCQRKKCGVNVLDICYIDMDGRLSNVTLKKSGHNYRQVMKDWILLLSKYIISI